MDFRKLITDIFSGNTEDLKKRSSLLGRKLRRGIHSLTSRKLSDEDLANIPVVINNRNRFTYLRQLIQWLERCGMKNIIILDNDSTYPPLLKYYADTKHKVIFLKRNGGPRSIWLSELTKDYLCDFYIYTDPDVVPNESVGFEAIRAMYDRLRSDFSIDKIGLALRIDDLPDHFKLKQQVIDWEKQFWNYPLDKTFFRAPVDTTFALYAPFARGGGECKALRTNFPFVAAHLPWYENSDMPNEEDEYYRSHSAPSDSHWTQLTSTR